MSQLCWVVLTVSLAFLVPRAVQSADPHDAAAVAEPRQRWDFFAPAPTREAADRLAGLERTFGEASIFRPESLERGWGDYNERRDLARWYVKALLRAKLAEFWRVARLSWGERRAERDGGGRSPMASGLAEKSYGASPQAKATPSDESVLGPASWFVRFERFGRFVERLTNEGVPWRFAPFNGRVRLDTQSAAISTAIATPIVNMGVSYVPRSGGRPLPFSGGSTDPDRERLVLSGAHTIPWLGIHGSVSYGASRENLSCGLARGLVGPLTASLERNWNMAGRAPANSTASLNLTMLF